MSRLYDRVMENGCRRLNGADVRRITQEMAEDEWLEDLRRQFNRLGDDWSDEQLHQLESMARSEAANDKSRLLLLMEEVGGATVVSAEEVQDYWLTLPERLNILAEVKAPVAPPFDRTFVEVQRRPDPRMGFESWGVLFQDMGRKDNDTWGVAASLVAEWTKHEPIGPVVSAVFRLQPDGFLASDGPDHFEAAPISHRLAQIPEDTDSEFIHMFNPYLGAALFAVSLMHCKNVTLHPVDPPDRLSRKHERKHGLPLTRYHVLDIAPMRQILDGEGEAQTKGLPHALHICRGHFKTFTEQAPLFGRHVGTYWWPSYVRGSAEGAVVEKDYRVRLDGDGIGKSYREADEDVTVAPAAEKADDPDTSQRGLRAHNRTQNLLAAALEDAGFAPRSPRSGEPDFDLAWQDGDTVWVAEVKSTTEGNEERQLRLAIGQVIRYRQKLSGDGADARAMIAVENAPFDESWIDLCGREGIALVWPEVLAQALGSPS